MHFAGTKSSEASSTMQALLGARCQTLHITNKDSYQNNKHPQMLALFNSPLLGISNYCNVSSIEKPYNQIGSLTVWALYAYYSDSQNAAFELLVWCM